MTLLGSSTGANRDIKREDSSNPRQKLSEIHSSRLQVVENNATILLPVT